MDMNISVEKAVDVICQHSRDGSIIPIKVRFEDEDGVTQEYKIKSYKDKPETTLSSKSIFPFDCKIVCFENVRTIRLTYFAYERVWKMSYQK